MWKVNYQKVENRSSEEWLTIAECIAIYVSMDSYPNKDMILAMIGIEKGSPAEATAD